MLAGHSKGIYDLKHENGDLKESLKELKSLNHELKSDLVDLKCRNMRDNLVFTNIGEETEMNNDGCPFENTESVLKHVLSDKLHLDDIRFERVHRTPVNLDRRRAPDKSRPIVAEFTYFKDRGKVRRSSYLLRGTRIGKHEQFPGEIEGKRRELYLLVRHFRKLKKHIVLVKDRLFVDGREVRAGEIDVSGTNSGPQAQAAAGRSGNGRHSPGTHQRRQPGNNRQNSQQ